MHINPSSLHYLLCEIIIDDLIPELLGFYIGAIYNVKAVPEDDALSGINFIKADVFDV